MSSIGRKTEPAGQTTITIYAIHAYADKAEKALTRVSTMLNIWAKQVAEQLNPLAVWHCFCDFLKRILTGFSPPEPPLAIES
jgi:hypothetical protein